METSVVQIDARRIVDRATFHNVFAEAFGFFDGYGCNMNTWIDCLTSLVVPSDGMKAA